MCQKQKYTVYMLKKSSFFVCFRTEVEAYNTLDPGVRVVILKALCDIRVEVLIS